jgi:hypothetical protein
MHIRPLTTTTPPGQLYLHSMPGRYELLATFLKDAALLDIKTIICLTSDAEIAEKSPTYFAAIQNNEFPIRRTCFPIPDFGVPSDKAGFFNLVHATAVQLCNGSILSVHCAGGIGRTGTFAACVLKALGEPPDALFSSGSGPETTEQQRLVDEFE